jgi:hypothetical protein
MRSVRTLIMLWVVFLHVGDILQSGRYHQLHKDRTCLCAESPAYECDRNGACEKSQVQTVQTVKTPRVALACLKVGFPRRGCIEAGLLRGEVTLALGLRTVCLLYQFETDAPCQPYSVRLYHRLSDYIPCGSA